MRNNLWPIKIKMLKFGFMEWRPRREMVKGEKGSKTQLMGRKIPSTFKRNKRKEKIAGSVCSTATLKWGSSISRRATGCT